MITKHRIPTSVAATGLLILYCFFASGFFFHTSSQPALLGKYSLNYFIMLCGIVLLTPYVFFVSRFLLTDHKITLRSGRTIVFKRSWLWKRALLFLLIVLAFTEVIVRLRLPDKRDRLKNFHIFLQAEPSVGDKRISPRRGLEEALHINQLGFRGEEIEKNKPENTYRIFFLGGSTVYCGSVNFEDSHVRILEKNLRAEYPAINIEVQNAGFHWHTTQHSLIKYLTHIYDFDPDLIIIYHAINDMTRSLAPEGWAFGPYRADYSHYYGPLTGMIDSYVSDPPVLRLILMDYFRGRVLGRWLSDFHKWKEPPTMLVQEWKSLPAFERNLQNFVTLMKNRKISLIMASQPFLYREGLTEKEKARLDFADKLMVENGRKPDLPSLISGMNTFNAKAESIAEENGIPFIDLEKIVPKSLEYFLDDVHYTQLGNKLIGQAISDFVVEQKLIDKRMRGGLRQSSDLIP